MSGSSTGGAVGGLQSGRARVRTLRLTLAGLSALLAVLGLAACASAGDASHEPRPEVAYTGTELNGEAPDFQFVDQHGASVALSDFRGRVVALAFLDPNCTDVCPLTAFHFRQAHEALGEDASEAAFLAVNVNPEAASVAEVVEASKKWGVDIMPGWHFLTGSEEELRTVWRAYAVHAGVPKHRKPGEVQHTPGVYIIDQEGTRRWYLSVGFEGAPPLSELLVHHTRELLKEKRRP